MSNSAQAIPITFTSARQQAQKISHEIIVGKDVLELVTGAMYVDPLTIFREYVQNAADAIDEAHAMGHYSDTVFPRVDITFDHDERSVRIRDTGIGVPVAAFSERLTAIGGSKKRGKRQRGFRGVGRLAGLGYAQQVIFRSRSLGDSKVYELAWDGRNLRHCLRSADFGGDLAATIREVTEISVIPGGDWPPHFFEVELCKVPRVRNDVLMNPEEIRRYLSQVAPVPFAPTFPFKAKLDDFLKGHGVEPGIDIYMQGEESPLYRPFDDTFKVSDKISDRFFDVELVEFPGIEGQTDAVGYVLHHSYYGALPRGEGISGLRLRSGNIQVGGPGIVEGLFTEQRFNGWCVAEIHVLSNQVIPNGRRDDFEVNSHYQNMHGHLSALASRISKRCRDNSIARNRLREANQIYEDMRERIQLIRETGTPPLVRRHFRENVLSSIKRLETIITQPGKLTDSDKALIAGRISSIKKELDGTKALRRDAKISFLPDRKQKIFVEFIEMMLEASESAQSGALLAKRIIDHAKRTKK